jgi:hypothetical protein
MTTAHPARDGDIQRPLAIDGAAHDWLKEALVMIMTLREDDASRWDPDEIVAFAKSFSLDALGFSVGGITAFYPTEIPLHPRSSSLGDRDLVGEIVATLKRENLRAIARIDPSMASKAIYSEHPEWFAHDRDGKPIAVHGHYVACPNGGYYRDFMIQVVEEILARYDFDGLWANAAQFSPWHTRQCYCSNCQRGFRAKYGAALPDEDWSSATWRQYNEWRYECIADWNELVQATKARVRPSCAWLPLSQVAESWDHSRVGGWDLDYTEPHQDGIVLEAQRRYTNMFWPGLEARYARALAPEKGSAITVSYFLPWWRFYSVPAAENQMWAGQIIAHGARPWLHVTGYQKQYFDGRRLDVMRDLFETFQRNRDSYVGTSSVAEVALVYSRHSLDNFGHKTPQPRYLDHFRGAYNAMMDQRIPFDILSDKRLSAESLSRYQAIVLPNAACLSDPACQAIEEYVRAGGHVVSTFMTGAYDAMGRAREKPLMERLLGVTQAGVSWTDVRAAYAAVRDPSHPLLDGFEGTDLLPVAGDITFLRVDGNSQTPALTLIPPVEGEVGSGISVPEFNQIDHVTNYPMVFDQELGRGRIIHFPWQPDLVAFRYGLRDLFRLLGNAVKLAPGYRDLIRVQGPGLVDVSVMQSADRIVISLVNFSAPGSFNTGHRRIIEELMPIHDMKIAIRLPENVKADTARLLFGGNPISGAWVSGYLEFTLPKLEAMETVEILTG